MENIQGFANHGSRYMVPTSARGFSLFGTWSSWVRVGYMYIPLTDGSQSNLTLKGRFLKKSQNWF
jgi:hypothetical protein